MHPPGEAHEYVNGPQRTLLFRVRYGEDRSAQHVHDRGTPGWEQSERDAAYFREPRGPNTTSTTSVSRRTCTPTERLPADGARVDPPRLPRRGL